MRDIKNRASGTGETVTKDPTCTSLKSQKGKIKRGKGCRKKIVSENFLNLAKNKCCTQYASKFGKLSSGHRIGKGQFSFQSQRKAMPKNAQTTARLHSSHKLVK